jgi:hypothetical protein
MGLRDRQIGGIPLTRGNAAALTIFCGFVVIPFLAYTFWFPLFSFILPQELRLPILGFGILLYFSQCVGNVPAGKEQAQLFLGQYTGISFPAGLYLIPRAPFPIPMLLVRVFLGNDMYNYLGWVLEGYVSVQSIVAPFFSEGLSQDGIRVRLEGNLVFEISNVAVYLSQLGDTQGSHIREALTAEASSRIKQRVIGKHTAKSLYQGEHADSSASLVVWISQVCELTKDFGVHLARSPVVTVTILNDQVRHAWDRVQAKEIFTDSAVALGEAFARFREKNPGLSEEIAWVSFASSQGLPPGTPINIIKFK